jgi:hypothetical protein
MYVITHGPKSPHVLSTRRASLAINREAVVFHRLNFTACLSDVNKLNALGLSIAFLDMRRQRSAFLIGPAFLGVLSFKSAAQHIFSARVDAAGKAFVDQRLKVGRDV